MWTLTLESSSEFTFIPNQWYDDNDDTTELNMNPWIPVYPWDDGTKIVLETKNWLVDRDYWILNPEEIKNIYLGFQNIADINIDQVIDLQDVMLVIYSVLDMQTNNTAIQRSDLNADGILDVSDVALIIQYALDIDSRSKQLNESVSRLFIEDDLIGIDNNSNISALQFNLSNDFIILDDYLTSNFSYFNNDYTLIVTGFDGADLPSEMLFKIIGIDNLVSWKAVNVRGEELALMLDEEIPYEFGLYNAYPNPFNASVNIPYEVGVESNININIYDISGRLIDSVFANKKHLEGKYNVVWSPENIASGIYMIELTSSSQEVNFLKKITLLK